MSIEHLKGWKLLVERIKVCATNGHDGKKRCRGCIGDAQQLKREHGRTKTGSLILKRIQRQI